MSNQNEKRRVKVRRGLADPNYDGPFRRGMGMNYRYRADSSVGIDVGPCPGCGWILNGPYESGRWRLHALPSGRGLYQHEHQDTWAECPGKLKQPPNHPRGESDKMLGGVSELPTEDTVLTQTETDELLGSGIERSGADVLSQEFVDGLLKDKAAGKLEPLIECKHCADTPAELSLRDKFALEILKRFPTAMCVGETLEGFILRSFDLYKSHFDRLTAELNGWKEAALKRGWPGYQKDPAEQIETLTAELNRQRLDRQREDAQVNQLGQEQGDCGRDCGSPRGYYDAACPYHGALAKELDKLKKAGAKMRRHMEDGILPTSSDFEHSRFWAGQDWDDALSTKPQAEDKPK